MSKQAQSTQSLLSQMTSVYFWLIIPLIVVSSVWATYADQHPNMLPVLIYSGLTLIIVLLYGFLNEQLQRKMRLVFAAGQVIVMALVAMLTPIFKITAGPIATHNMLLIVPMHALAWSFLFVDHPGLGRMLNILLAISSSIVVAYWLKAQQMPIGLAVLMLISCSLAAQFGWRIAQLQDRAVQSEDAARHDELTGLSNRRAFNEARQAMKGSGVVAVLDLDHFKRINDDFGHDAGDRVLRAVADVLLDTLLQEMTAYRWGGEEFVVVMPKANMSEAELLLEGVRREMTKRSFVGGTQITLSIGVAVFEEQAQFEDAFLQADAALMRAKESGRDRLVVSGRAAV